MNEAATPDFPSDDQHLFFADREEIELALLIGSRASGRVREHGDWEFAIQRRQDRPADQNDWNRVVGLRNLIVHEYRSYVWILCWSW